ncbi:MAG: class I SAM-dependent methyltransferase [Thermodesulfobacteriota bacterium]
MRKTIIYLKNFAKDKYVASITPTSKFAVERICDQIDFHGKRVIVEYGPGTGVFTVNLLRHMSADSRLIAIERNLDFFRILQRNIIDPRLNLFNDCAGNVLEILKSCGEEEVDYILSGIPFSLFPKEIKTHILGNAHAALKNGGRFLAYQNFIQLPEFLRNHLERIFHNVHAKLILHCLPPLILFESVKYDGLGPARLVDKNRL